MRGDGSKKELYLGVVQATDDQLKPLFDYVRNDPKLRDNTLIIVASDNGPEPGAGSAGSFKGQKGNLYEGGFREPFITWGPGLLEKSAAGTVNDQSVIAGFDLFPSLLAIIGQPLPIGKTFDGEDMSAAMLGKEKQHRTKTLMWLRPPDRPGPAKNPWPDLATRTGDMKLLIDADGSKPQLYNLANDPDEKHNLASDDPTEVEKLKKPLMDWYKSLPVEVPRPANAEANPSYMWWDDG